MQQMHFEIIGVCVFFTMVPVRLLSYFSLQIIKKLSCKVSHRVSSYNNILRVPHLQQRYCQCVKNETLTSIK